MENGQKTIRTLFDGTKIFNIPKYQRAFAWGQPQLQDFVDDIENQKSGKAYFMGTILLQKHPELVDGFDLIDVVDGQQRITTCMIYIKLVLDRLRDHVDDKTFMRLRETYLERYDEFKLRVLQDDNPFFHNYILGDHPVAEGFITTPSQRRLWQARQYLDKRLAQYSPEQLNMYLETLTTTRILTYSVESTADATLIFETTNDRGKGLTNLEKTKSFLMYKTYLAHEQPDAHLNQIQTEFSNLYRDYELIQEYIDEDSILQYHFIAFEKWSSTRSYRGYQHYVQEVKNRVNRLIQQEDRRPVRDYIKRYTRELRESFAVMRLLLQNKAGYLTDLFAVGRPAMFYPLLIKAWKYDQSHDKQQFQRVVRLAEIHTFRVIGIGRVRSSTGREKIYRLTRDFQGDFTALIASLKQMIEGYSPAASFHERLMSPRFYKNVYRSDQRYLFWQYENYLRRTEQPLAAPMSYEAFANQDRQTRLSIEHIAAQKPKPAIVEDKKVLPRITQTFQEQYLHCLGNLTFDPLSANISKSNNEVAVKYQKYFRQAPFKTQNELDTFINPETGKWDAKAIGRRRQKIVEFALAQWDYQNV